MVTSVSSTSGSSASTSTSSSAISVSSTKTKAATGQNVMKALGSGSGIDTAALAQSLVDAEKAPRADAINKNIKKSEAIVSGYAAVKFALNAVKTAFDDLKDVSDFSAVIATSNQTDIFSVATSSSTQPGSHSILVTQLAQEQRIASSQRFTVTNKPLTTNDPEGLRLTLRTALNPLITTDIKVTTATPAGVVDAINRSGNGINAQLVNTGNGYKITVSGASGSDNAFILESNANNGLDFGPFSLKREQISESAQTFSDDATVISTSPINLILDGDTSNPTTITVANPSPATIRQAIADSPRAQDKGLRVELDPITQKLKVISDTGKVNAFSLTTDPNTELSFGQTQSARDLAPLSPLQEAKDAKLQVNGLPITSPSNAVKDAIPGVTLNLTGINATLVNEFAQAKTSAATLSLANDTSVAKTKITALVSAYNDANNLLNEVTNPKSSLATYGGTLIGNSSVRALRDQLRILVTDPSSTPGRSLLALRDIGVEIDKGGNLKTNSVKLDLALNFKFSDTVTLLSGNQENQSAFDKTPSGLAGGVSRAIEKMLGSSGTPTIETDNANKRITKYQDDLTALDDRMTMILARYQKQFATMDSMVGQTKATQTGLTSTFAGMMSMYTNK